MLKRHTISFKYAFEGLYWALKTQPNYRIHLFLSLLSLIAGYYFQITYFEFLLIVFLITLGLTIETINTAIEATIDTVDTKWRQDIKIAKDAAAAAMLTFSIGAFVIAAIIFVPRILLILNLK